MPAISLRLTDEQHAQLVKWAAHSKRSIQQELIWRLFISGADHPIKVVTHHRGPVTVADAQPRDIPTRTVKPTLPLFDSKDPGFKPDFKTEKGKKK